MFGPTNGGTKFHVAKWEGRFLPIPGSSIPGRGDTKMRKDSRSGLKREKCRARGYTKQSPRPGTRTRGFPQPRLDLSWMLGEFSSYWGRNIRTSRVEGTKVKPNGFSTELVESTSKKHHSSDRDLQGWSSGQHGEVAAREEPCVQP